MKGAPAARGLSSGRVTDATCSAGLRTTPCRDEGASLPRPHAATASEATSTAAASGRTRRGRIGSIDPEADDAAEVFFTVVFTGRFLPNSTCSVTLKVGR